MKKLLLTTMAALTILFAQGQTPCDSITVTGSQNQLTLTSISIDIISFLNKLIS